MRNHLNLNLTVFAFTLAICASLIFVHSIFIRGLKNIGDLSTVYAGQNPFIEKNLIYAKKEATVGVIVLVIAFFIQVTQFTFPDSFQLQFFRTPFWRSIVFVIPIFLLGLSFFVSVGLANRLAYKEFVTLKHSQYKKVVIQYSFILNHNGAQEYEVEQNQIPSEKISKQRLEETYNVIEKVERLFELESEGSYEQRMKNLERFFGVKKN